MYINILRTNTNGHKSYQGQIKVPRLGEANAIKHAVDVWVDETMNKELYTGEVATLPVSLSASGYWNRNVNHHTRINIKLKENKVYEKRLAGDNVHPRDQERWQSMIDDNLFEISIMQQQIAGGIYR